MEHAFFLIATGLIGGSMNALAGGGSLVTLPALIAAGIPSISANATGTVAMLPGGITSAAVYRRDWRRVADVPFTAMLLVTLVGGGVGALLLLTTPERLFDRVLPWLLLTATITLAFAPRVGPWLQARVVFGRLPLLIGQFLLGIYGGYYGGAVGLMMLALWGLIDRADIKALAGTRNAMVSAANCVAMLCFVLAGVIHWYVALLVGSGAIIGGYAGARLGQKLSPHIVRGATLILCSAITIAFFIRTYP
ncbi:MAG: sulfite exporter TauE/SafE family protein [Sphingomonadales bacterium]|nr:MAG: sulfite exporter TauE/SafE family protein [Sphingomonadales bacterium]